MVAWTERRGGRKRRQPQKLEQMVQDSAGVESVYADLIASSGGESESSEYVASESDSSAEEEEEVSGGEEEDVFALETPAEERQLGGCLAVLCSVWPPCGAISP